MYKWDGITERRSGNTMIKDAINDLTVQISALSQRFDNELGSAKHPESEGSVKRHIRQIATDMNEMKVTIIGDGRDLPGIAGELRTLQNSYDTHASWDRWLFGFLIAGQVGALYKLLF